MANYVNLPTTGQLPIDDTFIFEDNGDATKQFKFECSGLTAGIVRTLTVPDLSDTLVTLTATQTLTNKTFVSPSIAIDDVNFSIQDNLDNTKILKFQLSGISAATTRTFTVPDVNDTLVTLAATQILSNKTLTAPSVLGITDTVQLSVRGHSTQTSNIFRVLKNDNTELFTIDNSGNGYFAGNLLISGTTTTIDSTTLTVVDPNIYVNQGGTTASANAAKAGITIDISDGTDAVIGYASSLASRFKVGDAGSEAEIVTVSHSQTLTNKVLTSPDINAGTADSLTSLSIRDTSAAFDVTLAAVSSTPLSSGRTLTLDLVNAARTIKLSGNLTLANDFLTVGGHSLTLTTAGSTDVTLPTTGTLSTLAGTEILSGKTLTLPKINDTSSDHQYIFTVSELISNRNINLPLLTTNDEFVFKDHAVTLTNKTLTAPDINGGTADSLTSLSVRDTSAAFDVLIIAASSTILDANRTLTLDIINASRSIKLAGNINLGGNLTIANTLSTSGNFPLTLTTTNTTDVTLPVSGTLSTLAGEETLSNKTLASPEVTTKIDFNGMDFQVRSASIVINNNQSSLATLFSYDSAVYPFSIIEYSIIRNTSYQTGKLIINSNGSTVQLIETDRVFNTVAGVNFEAVISTGTISLQYVSTNTGSAGTFRCTKRQWSHS